MNNNPNLYEMLCFSASQPRFIYSIFSSQTQPHILTFVLVDECPSIYSRSILTTSEAKFKQPKEVTKIYRISSFIALSFWVFVYSFLRFYEGEVNLEGNTFHLALCERIVNKPKPNNASAAVRT